MSQRMLIILVLSLLSFLVLGLAFISIVIGTDSDGGLRERLKIYAAVPELERKEGRRRRSWFSRYRLRLNRTLAALGSDELNLQLMSADWRLTASEYILMRIGIALLGGLLGWLLVNWWVAGVSLGVVAYFIPGILLQRSIKKRRVQFEKQMVDVLVLLNGAVRAGFSLLQSTDVVVKEMKPPASDEFRRVQREVGLGLTLVQALSNLARRMDNQDLNLVVTAISIHYQVGGNLAVMLAAVTDTIRDRIRLFQEARVLTTQQRYTSYIISVIPFFMMGLLFLISPEYMRMLFTPQLICVPIGAVISITFAHFAIKRVAKIDI